MVGMVQVERKKSTFAAGTINSMAQTSKAADLSQKTREKSQGSAASAEAAVYV